MTFHAFFDDKTLNFVTIRDVLGPNYSEVSYGSISRPSLFSIENVSSFNLLSCSLHVGCIRAIVRFCKSKTSYFIQLYQIGQEPCLLFLVAASFIDRYSKTILEEHKESKTHIKATHFIEHSPSLKHSELL
jgi:hypothetical protein